MAFIPALALTFLAAENCAGRLPGRPFVVLADARGGEVAAAGTATATEAGNVTVLADRGDLVAARDPFDLEGRAVRLTPHPGGYDPFPIALALHEAGTPLAVSAGSPASLALPFALPFFGGLHRTAWVHEDGSLTLGDPGAKGVAFVDVLEGPPRIAPFAADLDLTRGGAVTASLLPDRVVVQWAGIPGAAQVAPNAFEAVLHADGTIDLAYGAVPAREGIAGVAPGGAGDLALADLSAGHPRGSRGALLQRFSETGHLDLVSTVRRFLSARGDDVEQVVVYTTRALNPLAGSLAFEIGIRNAVAGIGLRAFDDGAAWGSPGHLESVVFMDAVDTYQEVDGFEVLGHEIGHRWGATLRFRGADGRARADLLAPDTVHWSFFADTRGSVLGGNDLADLGGGRFETGLGFARGYGPLDLYAMGLLPAADLPPVFYVAEADDFRPPRPYRTSSSPEAGVAFSGRRVDVPAASVVEALGPRLPPGGSVARGWRVAFVLVADAEGPATPERIAIAERIRARFEAWFAEATGGRGSVITGR